MHLLIWSIVLSIFWLLLSGYIQPLLLSFGVISVALVIWVLKRMDDADQTPKTPDINLKLLRYIGWLLKEIVVSSFHVTRLVWRSKESVSPALANIPAHNVKPEQRVLYANSITLTPGTLSIDLKDGEITVHALQKSSIDELKQKAMENQITGIWGENK